MKKKIKSKNYRNIDYYIQKLLNPLSKGERTGGGRQETKTVRVTRGSHAPSATAHQNSKTDSRKQVIRIKGEFN